MKLTDVRGLPVSTQSAAALEHYELATEQTHGHFGDPQASIDAYDVERVLSLPERSREIVKLISIDGHSAREVADRLGLTEVAVGVALHRSLKRLADTYQEKKL